MQSTAIVDLLAAAVAEREEEECPTPALIEAFAHIPDPRRRQGRRYPLPFLLGALVLALLCNCDTLEAVGQWCAEHQELLAAHFPAQRFHTPTGSLYRRLLPRLSVAHLAAALASWARGSLAAADDALALDGTTVRGRRRCRPRTCSRSPRTLARRPSSRCAWLRRLPKCPSRGRCCPSCRWPGAS